jgi:predicted RNA-binding protein with PIN domain
VHRGIQVWFAREYPDADTLIEELVEDDTAPSHLVVVSSDRRLQVAARRRRAKAVSCEEWLADARADRRRRTQRAADEKPAAPSPADVEYWKKYFEM